MIEEELYEKQVTSIQTDGTLVITLNGDIDHHTAFFLRQTADRHITLARPKRVCLDLSAVAFMDSAGLGFILGRFRTAQQLGASFCVLNPTERIDRILQLAGTGKLIDIIFENREKKGEA